MSRLRLPSRRSIETLLLAALAYLPALASSPGRLPADTRLYLYLDPAGLMGHATETWDTSQFAGFVPHQTVAYLWPSGPFYWVLERLGTPDWVAHRLWIGTLLFVAALGARWAARHLGLQGSAATVVAVVYATSPYLLPYVSRTSAMLLPWAGLGWLVGLTIRAATRTRWRDAALAALVILTVGAVNTTALVMIAPAPALWLLHSAAGGTISWRRAAATAVRIGGLGLAVSLWWITAVVVQAREGADVLAFSETQGDVALTATAPEALRGLGYWLFYVRDALAPATAAAGRYLGSVPALLVSFALPALALVGLATCRWSARRYAALLVLTGVVLSVGVHPIDDPAPLAAPFVDHPLGLALRSSTRAAPLPVLGLVLGLGALVTTAAAYLTRPVGQGAGRPMPLRPLVGGLVVVVAVVNLPVLWRAQLVDPGLDREQHPPAAWTAAAQRLDEGDREQRVLQLPGAEFGAFRWGYTVDPPLPGLSGRDLVTRDLLPLGGPGAMNLLYALDDRVQQGTLEPEAVAPVARFLAADTIWVANDMAFERFRTPRPEIVADLLTGAVPGLGPAESFGPPTMNRPEVDVVDEESLGDERVGRPVPPVQLVPVDDPVPIVRVLDTTVLLAGDGDGIVDAAAAGLVDGTEAVVLTADRVRLERSGTDLPADTPLLTTDSNRDRARHWRGSQDVHGFTESGGPEADVTVTDPADQRLDVFETADPATQTTAGLDADWTVRASAYGEPFAYRPEDRAAMAVDGDPATAWRVADRGDPVGHSITLSTTDGELRLLQAQDPEATRRITEVELAAAGEVRTVPLDRRSWVPPGQPVTVPAGQEVRLTITTIGERATGTDSGPSGVGFAELGPVATEVVQVPSAALAAAGPTQPIALVFSRDRVRPTNRWRSDPEPTLVRRFALPQARSMASEVTLRLDRRADDEVIEGLAGRDPAVVADRRLAGVPEARGRQALDGDPATSWITPFNAVVGARLTVPVEAETTVDEVVLTQPRGRWSRIIEVVVERGDQSVRVRVPRPDQRGRSRLDVPLRATGDEVAIEIARIAPATAWDRRYGETVLLPAAISELGGIPAATGEDPPATGCRPDLLEIDGTPLPVRVSGEDLDRLLDGDTAVVPTCGGRLELAAGEHLVEGRSGTGLQVDRLTLRDEQWPTTGGTVATPPVERSRTERTITAPACPEGCWLVLGESRQPSWTATVGGEELSDPVPVSGGFNGWWLPPADEERVVTMRWPHQGLLWGALALTVIAALICVVLVAVDRRRESAVDPNEPRRRSPLVVEPATVGAAAVTAVLGAALLIDPWWSLWGALAAGVALVSRRPRLLAATGAVGVAVLGLLVALRQRAEHFPADSGWPGQFEDLHRPALLAVVLLLAGSLAADRDRPPEELRDSGG